MIPGESNVITIRRLEFAFESVLLSDRKSAYGLIVLRDKDTGDYDVHYLTQFLVEKYRNAEYGTLKKRGYQIVKFLNFVFVDSKRIKQLNNIDLSLGQEFLNSLGAVTRRTVESFESTLREFYLFLIDHDSANKVKREDFYLEDTNRKKENPFSVNYPGDKRKRILHDIPERLIDLFIAIAKRDAHVIAFGIYLQIYGGLRVSEVVSLRYEDLIPVGYNASFGFEATLTKKTIVRKDTKNYVSTVKKERYQYIDPLDSSDPVEEGLEMYLEHVSKYKAKDNSGALFVNVINGPYRGMPMTKKNYTRYFNRVRKAFCNELINSENIEDRELGRSLLNLDWSTHIGRGIFTNVKARTSQNAFQVQDARGDAGPEASSYYFEKAQIVENQEELLINQTNYIKSLLAKKDSTIDELLEINEQELIQMVSPDKEEKLEQTKKNNKKVLDSLRDIIGDI